MTDLEKLKEKVSEKEYEVSDEIKEGDLFVKVVSQEIMTCYKCVLKPMSSCNGVKCTPWRRKDENSIVFIQIN